MSEAPFFSVIVPCYNVGVHFDSTIQSLKDQKYKSFEVLFVDDGSSPKKGLELTRKVADSGLSARVIRLESNSGPSVARNKGIVEARGAYICFLDSDDAWKENKLAVINNLIEKRHPHLLGHLMDGDRLEIQGHTGPFFYSQLDFILHNRATTSSLVVKKDVMRMFDEKMKYCEDYDLILSLLEENQFLMVPEKLGTLGRPVLSTGGQSSNIIKMRLGEMRAYWNFSIRKAYRIFFAPLLILFSCLKLVVRFFK